MVKFSVAVNEKYKDQAGELQDKTEWFNVTAWSGLAETCNRFLKKGSKVLVEGKLQTRSWQDDAGQTRYMTEVVAREVEFLSPRGENSGGGNYGGQKPPRPTQARPAAPPQQPVADFGDEDDVPF